MAASRAAGRHLRASLRICMRIDKRKLNKNKEELNLNGQVRFCCAAGSWRAPRGGVKVACLGEILRAGGISAGFLRKMRNIWN